MIVLTSPSYEVRTTCGHSFFVLKLNVVYQFSVTLTLTLTRNSVRLRTNQSPLSVLPMIWMGDDNCRIIGFRIIINCNYGGFLLRFSIQVVVDLVTTTCIYV